MITESNSFYKEFVVEINKPTVKRQVSLCLEFQKAKELIQSLIVKYEDAKVKYV